MFSEFLKLSSFYILSRQIFKIILQFHVAMIKYPLTTRNNNTITSILIEISKIVIPRSPISRIAGFQIEKATRTDTHGDQPVPHLPFPDLTVSKIR